MLNCVIATSRPRAAAGDISAMYIGETTEAPPIARPPKKRKKRKEPQFQGNALPKDETKYSTAIASSVLRRPYVSAGRPTTIEPTIVPMSAEATVNPSQNPPENPSQAASRLKTNFRASVVPEITAVSKQKSRPPRA